MSDKVFREKIKIFGFFFLILFVLPAAAFFTQSVSSTQKLKVFVTNYPLQYFAERIGGDQVTVNFPAPEDVDPAFWQPSTETLIAYQQSDLILLNGADYEKWEKKVSLPMLKTVNTSVSFANQYIQVADAMVHSHGAEAAHSHGETAFTTWLDFDQAISHGKAIMEALVRKRPEFKGVFEANFARLQKDLASLEEQAKEIVGKKPNQLILGSHPVYQYLSRRYRIPMKSVHWEPDLVPSGEQWTNLERIIEVDHPQWMIWEGKPNHVTLRRLKSMGVNSLVFDPCANVPEEGNWLDTMRGNLQNLGKAYR